MPEPAHSITKRHGHGRGVPFTRETALAANELRKLAPKKPRLLPPLVAAPVAQDPHAAMIEEAIRLASRALRAKMPARVRADLMAAMAPFFREARLIAKDDPGAKGASRAGRRPEEPPCVLLEDHPGIVEPTVSPVSSSGEPGVRGPSSESKP